MKGEGGFSIGIVLFQKVTSLDFVGPLDILSRNPEARIHLIAHTLDPIGADNGMRVIPDTTFADAPQLDMVLVPGGPGTMSMMEDDELIGFLRSSGENAAWITSVCTGSLLLGAAGLLTGYRAVTHWTMMDALPIFGAEPVAERVVADRNRVTGAGVSAGLDFALTLTALLWGNERAERIQLGTEYDPHPPFDAGSPAKAPPQVVSAFRAGSARLTERRMAAARRAARKLTVNA
ncbi:MAG: DJ-1/PfpI family protein [Sphingomonadaceae bacterium]|nr:DJ-1/PfpI family protein [Sphingomonadaceae bacterium]MCP5383000.1 DJ-1/PfpI family protein [Altererythrobacter sp.]MCP5393183.1 DJ-1/PfpI family protein [Sphingomonadaceae bacterium]